MKQFWLFVLASGLGGLGAALGSILGNRFGTVGLHTGALVSGAVAVALAIRLAVRLGLVSPGRSRHTTLGGLGGFALAALVAVNTLSSPVGPMLSVGLIGLGALFGAHRGRARPGTSDRVA